MGKTFRSAIVGAGVIGEIHARVLSELSDQAQLVALCDVVPEQSKRVARLLGLGDLPSYESVEALIKAEKPDVIHVCTPSGNHLEPALAAIEAGIDVICEKPLEIRLDRIDRMIAAAREKGVKLAGIFQNRWNPANAALKSAVVAGRFGRVGYAGCTTPWFRSDEYYASAGWRGTWKLDGGGAMMNQSVHAVDLLQWIAGPVKRVSAYAGKRIHPQIEVEDTLVASLQFASGAFGTIVGTTAMWPGSRVRIEIGGENGSAVSEEGLVLYKFKDERPDDAKLLAELDPNNRPASGGAGDPKLAWAYMHAQNIRAIHQAWAEGRAAETSGDEARHAVAIILAMYESARSNGAPIDLPV